MQFSLDKFTPATCTHVTKRTEFHGDDEVHVKDLTWKIESANTLLDLINPALRPALYKHAGTKPLPGMEDTTPELRCSLLEGPFALKYEGAGYLLTVMYGEVTEDRIELGGAQLAKLKVDPKEGGTIVLIFRTSHMGLSMTEMGRLDTFDGKELQILLAPPALQEGTTPETRKKKKADKDTTTQPFKFSVPAEGGIVDNNPVKDATETFVDKHGAPAAKKKASAKKAPAKKAKPAAAKKPAKRK